MIERAVKKTKAETVRLTVRTQSSYGESVPSNVVSIPLHTFNFQANKLIGAQPMGTPVKSRHVDSYQNDLKDEIQEKSSSEEKDENGSQETVKPIAKPRKDMLNPPVPKARTKGKPVIWKVDVEEDDSCEDSNRSGGDSALDEDEQVEICNTEMNEQQNQTTSKDKLQEKKVDGQIKIAYTKMNEQQNKTQSKDKPHEKKVDDQVEIGNTEMNEQQNRTPSKESKDKLHEKKMDDQDKMSNINLNEQKHTTPTKGIANEHDKKKELVRDNNQEVVEEVI